MVFKQFTVHDGKCAMKIGTDAVILGVLAAHSAPAVIVDIGTGSGVVALMLAQRYPNSRTLGIELEPSAFEQAVENIVDSPFNERVSCVQSSFQNWSDSEDKANTVDLLVSNPPFFKDKPKSPIDARNLARHDDSLKIEEIFNGASKVLREEGVLCLVWPVEREEDLLQAAASAEFHFSERWDILPTKDHSAVRFVAEFCKSAGDAPVSEIILEIGEGQERKFTPEYLALMSEFFLKA
jgi:tRNA1Val (adenine37-N6)-methyltransferase